MTVSFDAARAVNIVLITGVEYVNDRQVLALCGVMFDGLCYVMQKLGNWNLRATLPPLCDSRGQLWNW